MTIHDYYFLRFQEKLKNNNILPFETWIKEKEKEGKLKDKDDKGKYNAWLEESFLQPLAENKNSILTAKVKQDKWKKNYQIFYPKPDDLENLPSYTALLKIYFSLKKPYTSKEEGEFHILNGRITENPIVRDSLTGLSLVKPSTWKGHLRFAADKVESDEWSEEEKKVILKRLFGTGPGEKNNPLRGRLYFFPTFFTDEATKDVITPLSRETRTPKRGAISLEVIKPGAKAEFHLLYLPYPKGEGFKEEVKKDLEFLAESLKLMFYTYGFSAKKTSGFGVIEEKLEKVKIWIKVDKNLPKEADKFCTLDELKDIIEKWVGKK